MNLDAFIRNFPFAEGRWEVRALAPDGARTLLHFMLSSAEEQDLRRPPELSLVSSAKPVDRERVIDAVVRAGVQHPGLRNEDLRDLHAAARASGYIELFADLNALKNGLVQHVVRSLGRLVGRVVVSSSTIDVLHEYQALARRRDDGSRRYLASWEMGRALQTLDALRSEVPVHIHQLPVGSARYVRRPMADPRPNHQGSARDARATIADIASDQPVDGTEQEDSQLTFISEDRQMIGGYWDYATRTNPRLPFHLITSDFALAHVCAAERVPFLFARAPREVWRVDDVQRPTFHTLWFDPFALAVRTCLAHTILWELCLVFGQLNVVSLDRGGDGFSLTYDPRDQVPGAGPEFKRADLLSEEMIRAVKKRSAKTSASRSGKSEESGRGSEKAPAKLKLRMQTLVTVLPTDTTQRVPLKELQASEEVLRQFRQIGVQTGLFAVDGGDVIAGPRLSELLNRLRDLDYVGVNAIFEAQPSYRKVLDDVRGGNAFPSSNEAGAATGWAITLGAAYKSASGVVFGLAPVTEEQFERAVKRAHGELGSGQPAVGLADVLDRVCTALQMSPIRFEAMLNLCLGQRGLLQYEAQRASLQGTVPPHPLLVAPKTRMAKSYIETFEPAQGLRIGGKLVQSLVLRQGTG
jgi:hypothetical protein